MKLISAAKRPHPDAVYQGGDVWTVDDDQPGTALSVAAVPRRTDLPKTHPLYGKRVVAYVEAGQPSQVMGDDGKLRPNGKDVVSVNIEAINERPR